MAVVFSFIPVSRVFAQSSAAQKALEEVKDSVGTLIGAKDENNPIETGLRIETFKKVLVFSTAETKDLKLKLLSYDEFSAATSTATSSLSFWGKSAIGKLNDALAYYDEQKSAIEDKDFLMTLESIKTMAEKFKKWREEFYIPAIEEITSFLLTEQQNKAIETAENRWQKISGDVVKLKKVRFKKISELEKSLKEAGESIEEAWVLNKKARELFEETYLIRGVDITTTTSSATSTQPTSTSTVIENAATSTAAETNTTTTTGQKQKEKDESAEPPNPPPSIKDLVKDSLIKIRDAYQNFIEMSNLVRKLLN